MGCTFCTGLKLPAATSPSSSHPKSQWCQQAGHSRTPKPVESLGVKVYNYVDGTGGTGLANGDCSLESFSFQSQTNWWGGCWRGIPFLFAARTEHTEVPPKWLWSWSWGCRIGERFRQRTISVGFATSLTWKACRQSNPSRAFEALQALCLVLSRTRVCTYIFPWVQTTIRDICPDGPWCECGSQTII